MSQLSKSQIAAAERVRAKRERDKAGTRLNSMKIRLDILLTREDARFGFNTVADYRAEVRRVSDVIEQLESQLGMKVAA